MFVFIGTSGWSFNDWVGAFYPPALPKSEWLGYYAKYFQTTEINSSFYNFPSKHTVSEWIRKASKLGSFEYSLKIPKKVTHESLLMDVDTARSFEAKVLLPMQEAGVLGAILIQASPSLHIEDLERLDTFLSALDTQIYDYAIEFRHKSWINGDKLDLRANAILKKHEVALCAVDGPSMPKIVEHTGRHTYVRLHGRNFDIWYRKDKLEGRVNRYDYLYSREELEPWKTIIESMTGPIRVYFNNHVRANSAINARLFEYMLGLSPEPDLPPASRQTALSQFFKE